MKTPKYTTKMNFYIRILVAGYVVYLAYSLIPSIQEATGNKQIGLMIATAIMAFAGILIIVFSVKGLIKKEYYEADEIAQMEEERKADKASTEDTDTNEEQ